ncbi:MAG: ImmA/IrrE family metallo-endopeptidase, partial [Bdellovibrionales bacterium]
GTRVSGAVRWIGSTPVVQLSLLGAYSDIFWFNLFHELGHIVLHGKKEKFLEFDKRVFSELQEKEKEADNFATRELIDTAIYAEFIKARDFSKSAITSFAKKIDLDPGIVAGRLSHDSLVGWREVAALRTRLKFS